ncbi:MAG: hypothetical protein ACYDHM_15895, partial [Acidiferrobacterales bacterium]
AFSPGNIHHVSKWAMTLTKTGGDHALSGNSIETAPRCVAHICWNRPDAIACRTPGHICPISFDLSTLPKQGVPRSNGAATLGSQE